MSQSIITTAFERWKAQESIDGNLIVLDEFVFAHIPNLELEKPIDRNEGLPDAKYIVHRQMVNKTGVVNQNAVAYSVTVGAEIGDFDFNWIGLLNKKSGTVAMIVHAPTQRKIKTQAGQQGNVLTRSFLLEYLGASKETAINTLAEMWQIDFTARLSGIDEMQRLVNTDNYGEASFFGDAFLVGKTGNQYFVTKGIGYIGGLRAELTSNQNITVPAESTKVYADVSYQGNITSRWQTQIQLTVKPDLKNYIDNAGFPHFVFAIASISADGQITDLRPKGTLDFQQLDDALKAHEKSRNHPDATLTAKGFTQLTDKTGTSQALAPTQKLVTDLHNNAMASAKSANDNANTRLPSTGTAVASQKLATPRKISGVPFDGTQDITLTAGNVGAATPAQVNEAKTMATNAQNTANRAETKADNAQGTANSAVTKADNAQKTANDGVSKANTAQTTANNANNNANGRVPNTRKVNGKQLNADITLTAGDVGASTPAQVNEAKTMATNAQNTANSAVTKADNAQRTANDGVSKANTAQTTANNANNNANGRVPNTRKVNGKQLNADITLNAGDVGALTPAQGDVRYAKIGKGIGAGVKLIYDGPGYNWNKKMSFGGNFSGAWLMTQVYDRVIPLFPILDFAYNTYVQTGYDSAIQYKIEKDGITVVAGQGAILKKVWVVGV
ncbi:phage tail protein [Proteus faecis]|uniref:Phage tail protein n=3 Tax=Proteus faecis TaxID=2050967 RepID=A0AAW7CKD8_9GAMM|nr:phage tail protein [Proteus faecis]MDL5166648.1 phage tail protein [Proteus faecis]MDL5274717.1 phage tail protein [Proteus faecis]MDL5278202.1 phage tail protein [Proteus faecis]MDL5307204.1 phage tail protein [Proteus faecis]MDL5310760.1 phage tail protein [Proteus faecis]